ncbi:carboxypeptidase-like regulatory domain-containing protein [Prolixibacteraceae bacterium Z1-6]|uniref:Carboxypeptidase-like regulatory domain-containing protein n=1 Tax=Draconibacterium aestuarii TaxID=2998507 RepID=A0A9X3J6W5_9BACT|nr:carboxypeptidase-like regulatory domain-containing protein [Prolixibacteraceae bacterium Z1-6]
MHRKKLVILAAILLLSLVSIGQQQDGSVFERRITISQPNQTLDFILEQISWQANVFFSYDASIINSTEKYTIEAKNKSLYTVLNQLFDSNKFHLNELENQIIITKKQEQSVSSNTVNDSIQIKYFFLSGKIIEQRKGRPLIYASVSVHNKPIGTISNTDGEFLLKIHPDNILDTIIISSMGYAQKRIPAYNLLDEDLFILSPISIQIKEVKVIATTPKQLLKNMRDNLSKNYSSHSKLMTAFYRETVKQDNNYINVSEAVMEILKSPYENTSRIDLVRLLKGRKSPDVQPFKWLNFKLQGGPFTITQLDVIKTVESFIDPKYEELYNYEIDRVIWYNNHPVYVVKFHPLSSTFYPAFEGEMYVHRETFALLHASYQISKAGLKEAREVMIMKKPPKVKAGPTFVHYSVSFQQYQGKWQLASAQASVKFKVRSKRDRLNSEFHSVSDLLITNIESTELKRFTKDEKFTKQDIFVENLGKFDEKYWENYNIIKPTEDLRKAFKNESLN